MGSGASIPTAVTCETREALDSLPSDVKEELDSLGMRALLQEELSEEAKSSIAGLPGKVKMELAALAHPRKPQYPCIAEIQKETSVSCEERVQAALESIGDHDRELNCCVEVLQESALVQAKEADERLAAGGARRPLEGVPLIVKANFDIAGSLSTAGTPALSDWRPQSTAPVAQRLLDAGAIVVAKTTMPEFALGPYSWSKVHGLTLNSHNKNFTAGGSSMGTAQGIAAGYSSVGLGSDTAGSLRGPAELAGVVGFRPSKGRYSADGVVPCDIGMDTAGPMASSVADLAVLDAIITGVSTEDDPYLPASLSDVVVAVPPDWCEGGTDGQKEALEMAVTALEKAGAIVKREGAMAECLKAPDNIPHLSFREEGLIAYVKSHEGTLTLTIDEILDKCHYSEVRDFFKTPLGRTNMAEKLDTEEYVQLQKSYQDAIDEKERAWSDLFASLGAEVLLTPCLSGLPVQVNSKASIEEQFSNFTETVMSHMACYKPLQGSNDMRVPSLAMPTPARFLVPEDASGGLDFGASLPSGVLLWATPGQDRRLIEIAMALELALKEL